MRPCDTCMRGRHIACNTETTCTCYCHETKAIHVESLVERHRRHLLAAPCPYGIDCCTVEYHTDSYRPYLSPSGRLTNNASANNTTPQDVDAALDQLQTNRLRFTNADRQIGIERLSIIKRKLRGTR